MGLGQKAVKPVWVILPGDSSIQDDPAGDKYDAYQESHFADRSVLSLNEADPPAEFLIRPLTDAQRDAVEAMGTHRSKGKMAIRCALMKIKNYAKEDLTGAIISDHDPKRKAHGDLGEIITHEWMADFNMRTAVLAALWQAISVISEAERPLAKSSLTPSGSGTSLPTEESTASV